MGLLLIEFGQLFEWDNMMRSDSIINRKTNWHHKKTTIKIQQKITKPSPSITTNDTQLKQIICNKLSLKEVEAKITDFCDKKGWTYFSEIIKRESCYNNLEEIISF